MRTDFVGHFDMQRVGVGVGEHGDRLDPELAGRFDDPAGDFAAIGDQDLVEHGLPASNCCSAS